MPHLTRLATSGTLAVFRRLLARLSSGDRAWLARMAMQARSRADTAALAKFCEAANFAWKNKHYDVALNGEAAFLRHLAPFNPATLLDVGANIGDWSLAAAQALPGATIHAFEITEATAAILREAAAPHGPRIVVNAVGLADHDGEITLFTTPESPTAASTLRKAVDLAAIEHGFTAIEERQAQVIRGDAYLARHAISHVDLLKIDVEGAEFSVLDGFAEAFAQRRIDLVQFEYGQINLATRVFLADFVTFFEANGYVVGKLYPEGVAFHPYTLADEDFVGPNYIACRADRSDLIAAVRGPWMP